MAVRTEHATQFYFGSNTRFRSVVREEFRNGRFLFLVDVMEVQTRRVSLFTPLTPCGPLSFEDPSAAFLIRWCRMVLPMAVSAQHFTLCDFITKCILPIAECYHSSDCHFLRRFIDVMKI